MTFASLGLIEPLLRSLAELDYQTPTPVQSQAIPAVLKGRDLMAAAQTGTGKTAGCALPLLQRLTLEEMCIRDSWESSGSARPDPAVRCRRRTSRAGSPADAGTGRAAAG